MDAIHYSEARATLAGLMERVCDNHEAVIITRQKARPTVMLSLDDFNSWQETLYLMSNTANACRLLDAIERHKHGEYEEHSLIEAE